MIRFVLELVFFLLMLNITLASKNFCDEKIKFWVASTTDENDQWMAETGMEHSKKSSGWKLQVDSDSTNCDGESYCRLVATITGLNTTNVNKHVMNKKFQIFNENLSWEESKMRCEKLGGNLAIHRTPDDVKKFLELGKSSIQSWIFLGFSDFRVPGVFEDLYGNEVKPYWTINQPAKKEFHCGCTSKTDGLMYSCNCAARVSFMCEFDE